MRNLFTSSLITSSLMALFLLSSCEKDITVDLPQPEEQLVIEGYIEPGSPPYVLISKTAPYFAPVDGNSLLQYTVKNAKVTVRCVEDDTTYNFIELLTDTGYFYVSFEFVGQIGKTYELRVVTEDGKVATATTKIEQPIPLDSTWFKIQEGKDSLGFAWAKLSDPDTMGNNYRWFAKRIGKDSSFIAPLGSVFEDKFINGKSFDFAYNRGSLPNSTATDDTSEVENGFFKVGDIIVVKFCTITNASFKFWRSAETQSSNIGNPFASITPLVSNIDGGIGIWEGYSPSLDTIVAQ
jgi:Domain of unknown function (DUF4249)